MQNNLIVEIWNDNLKKFDFIHNHGGFECDGCGIIPKTIYVCWFRDFIKERFYLRYKCFSCLDKLKKIEGYLSNYFDLLGIEFVSSFPDIAKENNTVLFIAKNFIMTKQNDYIKKVR